VLELPEYRWPTWQSIGLRLFDRGRVFLRQAGTYHFGSLSAGVGPDSLPLHHGHAPQLEQSAIAHLGHGIEPLIRPLGFNWKIGVGLLTSVIAREVIVGNPGHDLWNRPGDALDDAAECAQARSHFRRGDGAAGLLCLCHAVHVDAGIVRRETNSWKWPVVQFVYMTIVAYAAAFAVNQVLSTLLK
jgi:ferrous iron transport protein B